MHNHSTIYNHGDIVYLRTDLDQKPRIVVAITIKINNVAYYELGCGAESSFHFDIEMSASSDVALKLGLEKEVDRDR